MNLNYRNHEERNASTYTGEAFASLYDASRNTERDQMQQEFRLTRNLMVHLILQQV